jgi:putative chitinase
MSKTVRTILKVLGVKNSQHLIDQAVDIRPKDPSQFSKLVDFFKSREYTDQLLTGSGWLHISWNPFGTPMHYVRVGYYK